MPESLNLDAKGLVFDVQGHSVHDGPGTRTTVFMAGCPLRCVWCCNPEGLFEHPVVMYREAKCKRCLRCIPACPHGAIREVDGRLEHDRARCDACERFDCVAACYHEALAVSGRYWTVAELLAKLDRDRGFWGAQGGVTLSGGEPLLQREFVRPLLEACKQRFIHTCVETTACLAPAYFSDVIRFVDWAFIDLKHMDADRHAALTGASNRAVLENVRRLAESDWPGVVVIRIPMIPGENDTDENVRATARFVRSVGLDAINILPFHRLGESKYRQLGQGYAFAETAATPEALLAGPRRIIEEEGLLCWVGYQTPF